MRAHQRLEDAILETRSAYNFCGNFWAGIFAKTGAQDIAASAVHTRACEIALRDARDAMRYVSWAAERALRLRLKDAKDAGGAPPAAPSHRAWRA